MYFIKQRIAFTMIEVVFVIVVLGIISSIGSTIIAQLYENYIVQRAMHRVSIKTELAVNQIVNRLAYRINSTVIARNPSAASYTQLVNITLGTTNTNNNILEWIGYDNDSFSTQAMPGWSGYCDTTASRALGNINTPGSNLSTVTTVINNLSGGTPPLAILFGLSGNFNTAGVQQEADCYGYNGTTSCIHQVAISDATNFTTNQGSGTNIARHYKLAWTAYAIVPVAPSDGTTFSNTNFDLELRYNYQPWAGTQYNGNSVKKSILLRKVTAFKFAELGGTVRIKLCATEQIGDSATTNISVCKEKVVIR